MIISILQMGKGQVDSPYYGHVSRFRMYPVFRGSEHIAEQAFTCTPQPSLSSTRPTGNYGLHLLVCLGKTAWTVFFPPAGLAALKIQSASRPWRQVCCWEGSRGEGRGSMTNRRSKGVLCANMERKPWSAVSGTQH